MWYINETILVMYDNQKGYILVLQSQREEMEKGSCIYNSGHFDAAYMSCL